MKIRIKKLCENAVVPTKAHPSDAGFDLVATSRSFDENGNFVYGTGLAFEIPEGHVGLVFPRSSISKGDFSLANAVGVIDPHYRGEVTLKFKTTLRIASLWSMIKLMFHRGAKLNVFNSASKQYEIGDRIGQLIVIPFPDVEFEEAAELSSTDRGEGGYGSSGK